MALEIPSRSVSAPKDHRRSCGFVFVTVTSGVHLWRSFPRSTNGILPGKLALHIVHPGLVGFLPLLFVPAGIGWGNQMAHEHPP